MNNREIKIKAKELLKDNLGFSIVVLLIAAAITGLASFALAGLGSIVLSGMVSVLVCNYFMSLVKNDSIKDFNKLFVKFDRFPNSILVNLIMSAIYLAASLIPIIICLILIWPTIMASKGDSEAFMAIFAEISLTSIIISIIILIVQVRFKFIFYILNETNKLSPTEYIKESLKITKGKFLRIIGFELSFIGWILLVIITFGLALIYVGPYYNISASLLYKELCNEAQVNYEEEVEIIG